MQDVDAAGPGAAAVRAGVLRGPGAALWRDLSVLASTGSTNADLAAAAAAGAPEGAVLLAWHQRAGRGRLGRRWSAPPGSSVAASVLLRPVAVPVQRWSWLPLLAGVAVAEAVERLGAAAELKWPNDVLVGGRKIAGILLERVDTPAGPSAVLGIGVNVSARPADLPDGATSLAAEGGTADLVEVAVALLDRLAAGYQPWLAATGDPRAGLAAAYTARCATPGRPVRAELPGGTTLEGTATGVDEAGRLLVRAPDGSVTPVGAGDVVHLR